MIDVAVAGGGITGLALAARLQRAGKSVVLLDARPQPGGNIRSRRVENGAGAWLVEDGPNSFGDASAELMELVRAADMQDALVGAPDSADRRFLFRNGRLVEVPTKPARMLLSPMLPVRGRLRLMAEPFIAPSRADAPEESLAAFCDRRLGRWARLKLLTPVVSGIYAGDPERLGAESAFPRMVALEREHGSLIRAAIKGSGPPSRGRLSSLRDGLAALTDGLAAVLGDAYRAATPVDGIARQDGAWSVRVEGGEHLEARHLVLATPAWVTAELLTSLAPDVAAELRDVHYAPMAVVHVGVRRDAVREPLEGFGFLVPRDEGVRILGTIFSSVLFPGRAPEGHELLTVFTGGELDPDAMERSDEELRSYVLDDLRSALGLEGGPALFGVTRWDRAIPQYVVGHRARLARIEDAVAPLEGLHLAGNWKGGIAMPDCVRSANAIADALLDAAK